MGESVRIVVDLAEVQRVEREVVATTPAPELAERLCERLRAMHAPEAGVAAPSATAEDRERMRRKLRRYGA
jgi:hypothetical protein